MYPRKKVSRKYEAQDSEPTSKENYSSCLDNIEAVRELFRIEEREGLTRVESARTVLLEYGNKVCVATIGAVEKSDPYFRIIHDGTRGVQVNPRIVQRVQVRNPGVSKLKLITKFAAE